MKLPGIHFDWTRLVPLMLVVLLVMLQFQLWFGVGNVPSAMRLRGQLETQAAENAGLQKRNAALAAEVADLKGGQAAIEERARTELGMVKRGETFYQIVQAPAPATP